MWSIKVYLTLFETTLAVVVNFAVVVVFVDYITKGPGSKHPAQRVLKKRVPQQHWPIFKASRRRPFECTQIQTVHASRYLYGGYGTI